MADSDMQWVNGKHDAECGQELSKHPWRKIPYVSNFRALRFLNEDSLRPVAVAKARCHWRMVHRRHTEYRTVETLKRRGFRIGVLAAFRAPLGLISAPPVTTKGLYAFGHCLKANAMYPGAMLCPEHGCVLHAAKPEVRIQHV